MRRPQRSSSQRRKKKRPSLLWLYLAMGVLYFQPWISLPDWLQRASVFILVTPLYLGVAAIIFFFLILFVLSLSAFVVLDTRLFERLTAFKARQEDGAVEEEGVFRGYRAARLVYQDDRLCFMSMTRDDVWGVEAEATCKAGHPVPCPSHTCGFYSTKALDSIRPYASIPDTVILECLYTGTVIPATRGCRAHKQHVFKVWLSAACTRRTCKKPSVVLGARYEGKQMRLRPYCAEHKTTAAHCWTIEQLRDSLPTDFAWV